MTAHDECPMHGAAKPYVIQRGQTTEPGCVCPAFYSHAPMASEPRYGARSAVPTDVEYVDASADRMTHHVIQACVLTQREWEFRQEHGRSPLPDEGRQIVTQVDRLLASHEAKIRADERAQIAARRDEVAGVLDSCVTLTHDRNDWSPAMRDAWEYHVVDDFTAAYQAARHVYLREITDSVLDALEVSDR